MDGEYPVVVTASLIERALFLHDRQGYTIRV